MKLNMPHEGAASLQMAAEDGRVLLAIHQDGTVTGEVEDVSEAGARFVEYLRAHLFEQAHTPTCSAHGQPNCDADICEVTPTDAEREALATEYARSHGDSQTRADFLAGWDAALAVQGEPTDAQVTAEALRKWPHDPNDVNVASARAARRLSFLQGALWMRAALRAAAATQEGEQA